MSRTAILCAVLALVELSLPVAASADDETDRFAVGLRTAITTAGGEPANDMSTNGVDVRYRLGGGWRVGGALEYVVYDFERPTKMLGLTQRRGVPTVDEKIDAVVVRAFVERDYRRDGSAWSFFWAAGAGFASPSGDGARGELEGGGTFDLESDIGTEILAGGTTGVRRDIGAHVGIELAFRADQHFVDWTVVDRVSGGTAEVDDFLEYGVQLGVAMRW